MRAVNIPMDKIVAARKVKADLMLSRLNKITSLVWEVEWWYGGVTFRAKHLRGVTIAPIIFERFDDWAEGATPHLILVDEIVRSIEWYDGVLGESSFVRDG